MSVVILLLLVLTVFMVLEFLDWLKSNTKEGAIRLIEERKVPLKILLVVPTIFLTSLVITLYHINNVLGVF